MILSKKKLMTDIDLVGEKYQSLTNTSLLNKGKVKLPQIKQDNIRQDAAKNIKRDSASAHIQMRRTRPPPVRSCTHFG